MKDFYYPVFVHRPEDFPKTAHFAILRFSSVRIPAHGQWAPGHGWDAEDRPTVEYDAYEDETRWHEAIARYEKAGERYVAFKSIPASVTSSVSINVGEE